MVTKGVIEAFTWLSLTAAIGVTLWAASDPGWAHPLRHAMGRGAFWSAWGIAMLFVIAGFVLSYRSTGHLSSSKRFLTVPLLVLATAVVAGSGTAQLWRFEASKGALDRAAASSRSARHVRVGWYTFDSVDPTQESHFAAFTRDAYFIEDLAPGNRWGCEHMTGRWWACINDESKIGE